MVLFGLDFGTTFSSVCVYNDGDIFMFKQNDSGYIPTSIFLPDASKDIKFGYDAELAFKRKLKGLYYRDLKRWVGCCEDNLDTYVKKLKPSYAVHLMHYGDGTLQTVSIDEYGGQAVNMRVPDAIAAYVRCILSAAEKAFGIECTGVVCSVPAGYNTIQRTFTQECVSLSGYHCSRIINEPSGAALSSIYDLEEEDRQLLVYDFGGGTFDVSAVYRVDQTFTVGASNGDMNLGGRDVDRAFSDMIKSRANCHASGNIEVAYLKECLSKETEAIRFHFELEGEAYDVHVSQEDLKMVAAPFIRRTVTLLEEVVKLAGFTGERNTTLVVVGGSSYLPGLHEELKKFLVVRKIVPIPDPRGSVAIGCALYADSMQSPNGLLLVDCASQSIGIADYRCKMMRVCAAGSPIPYVGEKQIMLVDTGPTSTFTIAMFEGDSEHCRKCTRVFVSDVNLKKLGVTHNVARFDVTVLTEVDSLGVIKCYLKGGNGILVDTESKPHYDFKGCNRPSRRVLSSEDADEDMVKFLLMTSRTDDDRNRCRKYAQDIVTTVATGVSFVEASQKHSKLIRDNDSEAVDLLLGRPFQGVLRGGRVKRISIGGSSKL
ncbi:HSP70h [Blackcurrant leafroll-associated virus 1]|uniref:HSP70h n=1 Tax=Blackcurrant leafroll-associated virus 1 TaxID=2292426 RepID=UPI000EB78EEF|nr:HSP70h [Blackcurrant leafroll-associated virus 1]AYA58349.1 HSP70h [Blackcurrant leafroll-associated virus 1]